MILNYTFSRMTEVAGFIPTKSSQKRKTPTDFKVITYESHKPKQKKPKIADKEIETTDDRTQTNEFDMKKSRYEVLKFGMSGFDPEKKEEAKIQLAIKLGAKPPKNKYKNYKQLQTEKKQQQIDEKRRQEFQQLGKNQLGKSNAKGKFFKKKKEKAGLLEKYGKASLKDVAKFNNNKNKK